MFRSGETPRFAQRLLHALSLIRSFLLLEDDYGVDWDIGAHERLPVRLGRWEATWEEPEDSEHPHRLALRGSPRERRPGAPAPREQVCLCPVRPRAASGAARVL